MSEEGFHRLTQAERLARVEVRVVALEEKVDEMNSKLDDLLALRNKGAGAFWFFSLIMGTGVVSFIYSLFGGK
jgi:hypothetical protein